MEKIKYTVYVTESYVEEYEVEAYNEEGAENLVLDDNAKMVRRKTLDFEIEVREM